MPGLEGVDQYPGHLEAQISLHLILRCVIPIVFAQYKGILVQYLSSLTQLYILFISI